MIVKARTVCCIALCMVGFLALIPTAEAKWKAPQPFEHIKPKAKGTAGKKPRGSQIGTMKKLRKVSAAKTVKKAEQPRKRHVCKAPSLLPPDRDTAFDLPEELLTAELTGDATPLEGAAYGLFGAKYQFGGNDISGIDCSAFVKKVYQLLKITLPRTAREQFSVGTEIPLGQLQRGDLLFFQTYASYPSHVAIYLGDNRMIHASSGSHRVTISSMDTPYYRSRYLGARRLIDEGGEASPLLLAGLK